MRLIVHIGGAKCGSTAIQHYLRENVTRLANERGILVPGTRLEPWKDITGEQIFFFENMRKDKENGLTIVQNRLRRLHAHMQSEEMNALIISGENLINPGGFEKFFEYAQHLFDIEVILYIRRQDQYLVSAWQQWHLKSFPSLQAYVDARLGRDANWNKYLAPWENLLGSDRITLRRFSRDLLVNGDVTADFFHTMGLGDLFEGDAGVLHNRSFSEHLGSIASRISDVFEGPHDNQFYDVMRDAIGPEVYKSSSGSFLFSLAERQQILAAYETDNAALKEKYFPELGADEPLFHPPKASEVVEISEDDKRKAEIDLLARAVYNMSLRLYGPGEGE